MVSVWVASLLQMTDTFSQLNIIGSDNGLSLGQRQAIIYILGLFLAFRFQPLLVSVKTSSAYIQLWRVSHHPGLDVKGIIWTVTDDLV